MSVLPREAETGLIIGERQDQPNSFSAREFHGGRLLGATAFFADFAFLALCGPLVDGACVDKARRKGGQADVSGDCRY
jgi:hypothetical protein